MGKFGSNSMRNRGNSYYPYGAYRMGMAVGNRRTASLLTQETYYQQMKVTIPYNDLIRDSYGFSEEHFSHDHEWEVLRCLYERNYVKSQTVGQISRIPKIVHMVWLGGELPEECRKFLESWQRFHPLWEVRLWGDKEAEEFPMTRRDMFEASANNGQKSDIFRAEILYKYGGIYCDTDFECLKPFDDLLYLDFFTSSGYVDKVELYIGLMASIPQHPIIGRYLNDMTGVDRHNSIWNIFETTGSWYMTKCFFKEVDENTEGVVAFAPGFFYPWPNNDRGCLNPEKYIKDFSYAIHHWAVSWVLRKK